MALTAQRYCRRMSENTPFYQPAPNPTDADSALSPHAQQNDGLGYLRVVEDPGVRSRVLYFSAVGFPVVIHFAVWVEYLIRGYSFIGEALYSNMAGLATFVASIPMLVLGICGIVVAKSSATSEKVIGSLLFGATVMIEVIWLAIDIGGIVGFSHSEFFWGAGAALQFALYMIAWNFVRGRALWVNMTAAGAAVVMAVVWRLSIYNMADLWYTAYESGPAAEFYGVFVYLIWVGLAFAGLSLMHLLGNAATKMSKVSMPGPQGSLAPASSHTQMDGMSANTDSGDFGHSPVGSGPSRTMAMQTKTNTLAIVSLVSAFFISIVAVITGHMALKQIEQTGEQGRGLALTGLVIGYVSLGLGIVMVIVTLSGMASMYSY